MTGIPDQAGSYHSLSQPHRRLLAGSPQFLPAGKQAGGHQAHKIPDPLLPFSHWIDKRRFDAQNHPQSQWRHMAPVKPHRKLGRDYFSLANAIMVAIAPPVYLATSYMGANTPMDKEIKEELKKNGKKGMDAWLYNLRRKVGGKYYGASKEGFLKPKFKNFVDRHIYRFTPQQLERGYAASKIVLALTCIPKALNGIRYGLTSGQPSMIFEHGLELMLVPLAMTASPFANSLFFLLYAMFSLGLANDVRNEGVKAKGGKNLRVYDMTRFKDVFKPYSGYSLGKRLVTFPKEIFKMGRFVAGDIHLAFERTRNNLAFTRYILLGRQADALENKIQLKKQQLGLLNHGALGSSMKPFQLGLYKAKVETPVLFHQKLGLPNLIYQLRYHTAFIHHADSHSAAGPKNKTGFIDRFKFNMHQVGKAFQRSYPEVTQDFKQHPNDLFNTYGSAGKASLSYILQTLGTIPAIILAAGPMRKYETTALYKIGNGISAGVQGMAGFIGDCSLFLMGLRGRHIKEKLPVFTTIMELSGNMMNKGGREKPFANTLKYMGAAGNSLFFAARSEKIQRGESGESAT